MLVDNLDYFKTSGGAINLATTATTAVTSDSRFYPPEGKYADGSGEKIVEFYVISSTAAAGASFAFDIMSSDTDGSFVSNESVVIPLAGIAAGKVAAKLRMPLGLKKYVVVKVTPASSMTGALTINARIVFG